MFELFVKAMNYDISPKSQTGIFGSLETQEISLEFNIILIKIYLKWCKLWKDTKLLTTILIIN